MKWHEKIISAHLAVTDKVSHYGRMKSDRYFVWQEEAPDDLIAESAHRERAMNGTTDLFTKREFDPWADEIERAFSACGIAWTRISTQYEDDTGYIHIEWRWSVVDGSGDD